MSIALSLLATCSEALVVGPGLAPGHGVQVHRASSSIARRAAGRLSALSVCALRSLTERARDLADDPLSFLGAELERTSAELASASLDARLCCHDASSGALRDSLSTRAPILAMSVCENYCALGLSDGTVSVAP